MNFKLWLNETEYRDAHQAPTKSTGYPLHNLKELFPADFFTLPIQTTAQYYGDKRPDDILAAHIIKDSQNKPNKQIKIYRAVPDFNHKINKEIKSHQNIIKFFNKYAFPPMNSQFSDKFKELNYNKDQFSKFLYQELEKLSNKKEPPLKINQGDWITLTKSYANSHSEQFDHSKIISKTVPARHIFNADGNIHEFGYDPH